MAANDIESYILPVLEVDEAHGKFVVEWPGGPRLPMRLKPGTPLGKAIAAGAWVRVWRERVDGKPRYRVALAPADDAAQAPAPIREPAPTPAPPADESTPSLREAPPSHDSTFNEKVASASVEAAKAEAAKPIECPPIGPFFAPGGPVSALLGERYRPRSGQVAMAEHVRTALVEKRHAVLEAGTGIGKSFAYLLPTIWAGARAVVSTSNKALMTQLWRQDIPALQHIAPRPFTAALLKGRANYLCALKLEGLRRDDGGSGAGEYKMLRNRLQQFPSGDVEELGLNPRAVARLTVDRHECEGRKCAAFGHCFYELAKETAQAADVVITNHALLCQSALVNDNKILPIRSVLIIDEAHELERYAINALTQSLDSRSVDAVIHHPLARDGVTPELRDAAAEWTGRLWAELAHQRQRGQAWAVKGEIQPALRLWDTLRQITEEIERMATPRHEEGKRDQLFLRAAETTEIVHALAQPEGPAFIRYCSVDESGAAANGDFGAHHRPLEVDAQLRNTLWQEWPRVIATSATLGIANDLAWFTRRVGLHADAAPVTATLRSPFNYQQRVLIYTPTGLEPAYAGLAKTAYEQRLADEVRRLLMASRGRAFVLCTSRGRMDQLYDALAPRLPHPCFCQGRQLSRAQLLEEFRAAGDGVLFGTRSFWEGVDIPGEALSLVILDKIPFLPTDDPVYQRQVQLIESRNGNPFQELQLANAILTLRQGAGRLMRAETDRGVIAILDSRLRTARYGETILRSLPDGRVTVQFEEVAAFFQQREPGRD